jgi:DNA-binding NarL/FixJ family response regulator
MTVHIADDHKIIIEGFVAILLNKKIDIVGTSGNGHELIEWLKKNDADIIILDISMPIKNGIEVLEYFKENNIIQKVIIVSTYVQLEFIRATLGNGAQGFISKALAGSCIAEALRKVDKGETYFSTDVQELLIRECLSFRSNANSDFATSMLEKSLSKQEINILLLHAQNLSSQEISEELKITKSTIRSYKTRIREKLNIPEIIGISKRLAFIKGIKE